ncbi:MAG: glycosyltransferase [Leptolyngbyaceae cyanobacterium CRU_2_3]|nr:glycosyltransferase [Acaryochloris sp. SU_5_25]NJM64812.1 glycosyltransferase [Acaryochloris sp. RU_4_1]NJR64072.1 glycosyltransferase [Leptolyngbyaceae cyanobacterium CRU_2_3]
MRKLYFLVPGLGGQFACGGLWAELKTLKLTQQICAADVVTYKQRHPDTLFLADLLGQPHLDQIIFVISWGFDVGKLAQQLRSYNVVYHAHSAGYGFSLPARVPIITVSRNTLGYWGQRSPHSLLYYLPNQISDDFCNLKLERDIDVLVQARKSSTYLMQDLIPALQQVCQVKVVDSYVEGLSQLFNRTKVYLYDSAEYWAQQGVSEGFGLQPMEAMACGCQVFSSLNSGLSDYLDPGFNCYKIAGYSRHFDVQRICNVIQSGQARGISEQVLAEYRADNIRRRLQVILTEINDFFDSQPHQQTAIAPLTKMRITQLRLQTLWRKLQRRLS